MTIAEKFLVKRSNAAASRIKERRNSSAGRNRREGRFHLLQLITQKNEDAMDDGGPEWMNV